VPQPLNIDSTRFGRIELESGGAIEFPHGLVGFDSRRFALIARDADDAFLWLHSLDDPSLALPVTDPRRFFPDYRVQLADGERERLGLPADDEIAVYVTVRASERIEDCAANLRAPLLIAGGRGHQVVNQAPDAPLRAPLFTPAVAAVAERCAERCASG
jgi:flagellar assembly factor FliW